MQYQLLSAGSLPAYPTGFRSAGLTIMQTNFSKEIFSLSLSVYISLSLYTHTHTHTHTHTQLVLFLWRILTNTEVEVAWGSLK